MLTKDQVVEAIREAFPALVPPAGLPLACDCERSECCRLRNDLPGHAWTELTESWFDYDCSNLPLIAEEAFAYYCAAWMLYALQTSERQFIIVWCFTPNEPETSAWPPSNWTAKYSHLNAVHKNAIALWLEYVTAQPGSEDLRPAAEYAIRKYWRADG